jgi:hypothetical protein
MIRIPVDIGKSQKVDFWKGIFDKFDQHARWDSIAWSRRYCSCPKLRLAWEFSVSKFAEISTYV